MIKITEYAKRRRALMQKLGSEDVVILAAAPLALRNGDAHYPYRQNSDFLYLTGFDEPEAVVVLLPKRAKGEYLLFNRPRHPEYEKWDGPRAGQAGASKHFLADESYPIKELEMILPTLLCERNTIFYALGQSKECDALMMRILNKKRAQSRGGMSSPATLVDIGPLIHEMRLFKSADEIKLMQQAIDISAKGHIQAMRQCKPGLNECELDAVLAYEFKRHGSLYPAYTSIVGAGKNTCVLHYIRNDAKLADGDLILIDAGAEYQGYAADITRTFPANGRFSTEQRAIYDIVLSSQLAGIKAVRPGQPWGAVQEAIVKVITQGLLKLGILKGTLSSLIAKKAYLPFYMHQSGHWLGMDVHDVGNYKLNNKWRALKAGMVLTVEPGIYISADIAGVHKRWHNIGVRIEDDILVTVNGCKVLSQHIPKKIAEIEAVMAK